MEALAGGRDLGLRAGSGGDACGCGSARSGPAIGSVGGGHTLDLGENESYCVGGGGREGSRSVVDHTLPHLRSAKCGKKIWPPHFSYLREFCHIFSCL